MGESNYTRITVPISIYDEIEEYISKGNRYRNPTEFMLECTRVRLSEIHRAELDQKKLDAFFMKVNNTISSHNRTAS